MAEAFLRKHGGDRFEVHSAGLNPTGINPLTIQVMNEVGIDMDEHRSKSVSEYLGKLEPTTSSSCAHRLRSRVPESGLSLCGHSAGRSTIRQRAKVARNRDSRSFVT